MNPETNCNAPGDWFGRTPAQVARAAVLLCVFGGGAVVAVERMLTRAGTPLGIAYRSTGLPLWLPLVTGCSAVLVFAAIGAWQSLTSRERYRITPEALEVEGPMGCYRIRWTNVADAGVAAGGALGIRLRDPATLVETHVGTSQQREWLATARLYGEWDLLYPRASLGREGSVVLDWIRAHLPTDANAVESVSDRCRRECCSDSQSPS